MIIVVTYMETNERNGRLERFASHGINTDTDKIVTLPQVDPEQLGARFDPEIGEYVLKE